MPVFTNLPPTITALCSEIRTAFLARAREASLCSTRSAALDVTLPLMSSQCDGSGSVQNGVHLFRHFQPSGKITHKRDKIRIQL
jgi:hypothetical protein